MFLFKLSPFNYVYTNIRLKKPNQLKDLKTREIASVEYNKDQRETEGITNHRANGKQYQKLDNAGASLEMGQTHFAGKKFRDHRDPKR